MPQSLKIATCCYCGTRAALVMDRRRHELACSSCGAPLHEMKMLPKTAPGGAGPAHRHPVPARDTHPQNKPAKPGGARPRKRRKGLGRKMLEEIWDVVEDIFD